MLHKRRNSGNITWCGLIINEDVATATRWMHVSCPECKPFIDMKKRAGLIYNERLARDAKRDRPEQKKVIKPDIAKLRAFFNK